MNVVQAKNHITASLKKGNVPLKSFAWDKTNYNETSISVSSTVSGLFESADRNSFLNLKTIAHIFLNCPLKGGRTQFTQNNLVKRCNTVVLNILEVDDKSTFGIDWQRAMGESCQNVMLHTRSQTDNNIQLTTDVPRFLRTFTTLMIKYPDELEKVAKGAFCLKDDAGSFFTTPTKTIESSSTSDLKYGGNATAENIGKALEAFKKEFESGKFGYPGKVMPETSIASITKIAKGICNLDGTASIIVFLADELFKFLGEYRFNNDVSGFDDAVTGKKTYIDLLGPLLQRVGAVLLEGSGAGSISLRLTKKKSKAGGS